MPTKPKPSKTKPKSSASNAKANLTMLRQFAEALQAMSVASTGDKALDRAEDLVLDAWDARTARQRIALAKKAIEISPRCADAFVILAGHEAPTSDEALDLYRKGVAAGEAAIGPDGMEDMAGQFWGFIETRPYMRARCGLANCLRERGDVRSAASEYRAMIELNPNDNQGIRYTLMSALQHLREEDELTALLASYPESSACWTYTDALASFRREGATPSSSERLRAALASNGHVPPLLLGKRKLPASPGHYSPGQVSEAILYAKDNAGDWAATDGALSWLSTQSPRTVATARRAKGGG